MASPKKTTEKYTYTESVYFNSEGEEVYRERNYDDSWYDTVDEETITEEELEDVL